MKDLDVFHPSYRVKRITEELVSSFHPRFREERKGYDAPEDVDLFLDIIQNERLGLINVDIKLDKRFID
jgi:hypothetical protein